VYRSGDVSAENADECGELRVGQEAEVGGGQEKHAA